MRLETLGLSFLRKDKGCPVALFERTPRARAGQPDILGVTNSRYLLEIEIKRSMSDFRANRQKSHIIWRDKLESPDCPAVVGFEMEREKALKWFPKFYWFLVPQDIAMKVQMALPTWAGLISSEDGIWTKVIVEAPVNKFAAKLHPKEALMLGRLMSNQIWSFSDTIDCLQGNRREFVGDEHESGMSVFI